MKNLFHLNQVSLGLEITFNKAISIDQIEGTTEAVYNQAWQMAKENGFTEILRVWNFIPRINEYTKGIENYQHFCKGRKAAYNQLLSQEETFPAASAVGSLDLQIHFKFLFGHQKPIPISNRLQVEAYRYPSDYGPTPPSFSRASTLDSVVFVSGTASIRGHQTMFIDDLQGQLQCTLENIDEVLHQAKKNIQQDLPKHSMNWRVYLRNPDFKEQIESNLLNILGSNIEYMVAGICRSDLLVEIEGAYYGV